MCSRSTRPTTRRSLRSTRSIGARSAGTISSASSASASSSPTEWASARRSTGRWPRSTRALGKPEDAIAAYREVLASTPRASLRWLRWTGSSRARPCGTSWPRTSTRSSPRGRRRAADPLLMLRLAALRERVWPDRDAIDIYRQVLERDPENPEALGALERLGQSAEHELAIAEILEPLYRQSGDYQKLIGVHEVQVRRSDDPRVASSCSTRSRRSTRTRAVISRRHSTRTRGRSRRTPGSRRPKRALDRLARATGRFADLAKVYEELAAAKQTEPALASALFTMSARVYEGTSAMRTARSALPPRARARPRNLHAAESLERIFRGTERYGELVAGARSRRPTSSKSRRRRSRRSSRRLPSRRTSSRSPKRPSPSTVACSSSTAMISARSTR
jgi:tetratricopeptide (TPR) repeat protein